MVDIKNKYVGETKHQRRHGYGVYKYDNQFFRYEGQWENGVKHGHGKLILGDSGYYEGRFERGEIQGHGYRVFGLSGSTYSGQFHQGEIHGQGLLRKTSGEQYEGSWVFGKKQGEGIFTDAEGGVYEGSFHDNRRHGEGRQVFSNGDQYDGEWVLDKRHGHGLQRYSNGTIYDGQWRGDVCHGEGSISHVSGVTYTGLWVNGRPACEPVRLEHVSEREVLSVEQGKPFSLSVQSVDTNGEITTLESGRCFKVTAAIKKAEPSVRKSKTVIRSPPPSKGTIIPVISTPFGYTAVQYSILQVSSVSSQDELKDDGYPNSGKNIVMDNSSELKTVESNSELAEDELRTTSTTDVSPPPRMRRNRSGSNLFTQNTRSLVMGMKLDTVGSEENKVQKKDEEFLDSLISPFPAQVTNGRASFNDLFIPPPPLPDISHIVTQSTCTSKTEVSPEKESRSDSRRFNRPPSQQSSPRGASSKTGVSSLKSKKTSEKIKAEKERLLNPKREKYALPGTYVLIVSEATYPPFLDGRLPDLYVELSVVVPKTSREQSMDKLIRSKSRLKVLSRIS